MEYKQPICAIFFFGFLDSCCVLNTLLLSWTVKFF
ncbi:hypothetical protein Avbf_10929 [Armadillidium vulgare]|nr:hypothetical protein Avbf_10929 [Armadillidium vulgare]